MSDQERIVSTEPSREHVEAVAWKVARNWTTANRAVAVSKSLLTSTDPAVLDAMQDALVRAGRLTKDDRHEYGCPPCYYAPTTPHECVEVRYDRYVTEWQEVEP